MSYIIIVTRPKKGREFYGPFETIETAQEAAESKRMKPKWEIEIAPLRQPATDEQIAEVRHALTGLQEVLVVEDQ